MNQLVRRRLFTKIHGMIDAGYGQIIGLPSSGKTTLLRQFCQHENIPSLRIDASGEEARSQLGSISENRIAFPSSTRGTSPERTLLYIENFDRRMDSDDFKNLLREIIERPELSMGVITISREECGLYQDQADMLYPTITNEDLACTPREARGLAESVFDVPLSDGMTDRVMEISRGWILALLELFRSLRTAEDADRKRIIDKVGLDHRIPRLDPFFEKTVLQTLPNDIVSPLVLLGTLSRVTPALAEYCTGDDQTALLEHLAQKNLFLTYSVVHDEYHFHPVFSSFLSNKARTKKCSFLQTGLTRAGCFLKDQGRLEQAFHSFIRAERYKEAEKTVVQLLGDQTAGGFHQAGLSLLRYFPKGEIEKSDSLLFYKAISENLLNPIESRELIYSIIARFKNPRDYSRAATLYTELLLNHIVHLTSLKSVEELIEEAKDFADTALTGSDRVDAYEQLSNMIVLTRYWIHFERRESLQDLFAAEAGAIRNENNKLLLVARTLIAAGYLSRGEKEKAREFIGKAEELFGQNEILDMLRPLVYYILLQIYYEIGEMGEAIIIIEKFFEDTRDSSPFRYRMKEYLFFCLLYSGRFREAEGVLEDYRSTSPLSSSPYLQYFYTAGEMLISYIKGYRERASFFLERLRESGDELTANAVDPFYLFNIAEVYMYEGMYENAETILKDLMLKYNEASFPYLSATGHALLAVCSWRRGKNDQAADAVSRLKTLVVTNYLTNLEICSIQLLRELTDIPGCSFITGFPRLAEVKGADGNDSTHAEFRVLGGLSFTINGASPDENVLVTQKKVMHLLALLILYRKKRINKEWFFHYFWPDVEPGKARLNLKNLLHRLRNLVGAELVDSGSDTVGLDISKCRFDIDEFQSGIQKARRFSSQGKYNSALELYGMAFLLYQGDCFPEFVYEDEFREERENLRQMYMISLFNASKTALSLGEYGKAQVWLKKIITAEPCCEAAYRILFIIYAKSGLRYKAFELQRELEDNLLRDFGMKPEEKTYELIKDIADSVEINEIRWTEEIFF